MLTARKQIHIALVGNPNIGKSSLFNCLTGLKQKVGNFPGVTVDKKTGSCMLTDELEALVIDLPGTYSLYPRREDEWVTYQLLLGADPDLRPDLVVLVADASNLKRNLLFASQIIDLNIPVIMALSMMDIAGKKGITLDVAGIERELGVRVIPINPLKDKGIQPLKRAMAETATQLYKSPLRGFINHDNMAAGAIRDIQQEFPGISSYKAIHYLMNHEGLPFEKPVQNKIEGIEERHGFNKTRIQADEIIQRYARIKSIMQQTVVEEDPLKKSLFSEKLDGVLLHRRWGYLILLGVLFLLFQSIFWLAQYPMDWIEGGFGSLTGWLTDQLPKAWWSDLFLNGILAGLSGILVFVPQIMILFGLITLLEDSGYMARISFLTDGLMRRVGLNGKSILPLIGGLACAVPAIMSARNIENKKERLLTILVTPLISCSARLPVYTILVGLVIPKQHFLGFIGLQGLVMMGLYLLGLLSALLVAWILKFTIKIREKSFFILELPVYRAPRWKNAVTTMISKARIFVLDAGKVIMIISLILWALSSFGPPGTMEAIDKKYENLKAARPLNEGELDRQWQTEKLERSFAGIIGKAMEPAIAPLGYDWKIGIALVTSFAAREVFVGTMATLYSVEGDESKGSQLLRDKMRAARKPDGRPMYDLPTGISLLIFYVLAMQCMSTLAVTRRETRSWKWPVVQLVLMTGLAYLFSLIAYQILK